MFFSLGLNFGLRGGSELYNLTKSNVLEITKENTKYLVYQETSSKTNAGGLGQRRIQKKRVEIKENVAAGDRCIVRIFRKYASRCDPTVHHIFCQPIPKPTTHRWFSKQRLGLHSCQGMLKNMAQSAELEGRITNHSLRKATVTRLCENIIDDTVIKSITGHRSKEGLDAYKKLGERSMEEAFNVLQGTSNNTPTVSTAQANNTPVFNFYNCSVTLNTSN